MGSGGGGVSVVYLGGKAPTAEEKRWHDWVASQGCACCFGPAQIHHCVGSTARQSKVHIGQWFVIPLCDLHHKVPHGIHGDPRGLAADWGYGSMGRKELEKVIFFRLVAKYRRERDDYPLPADALRAIEMVPPVDVIYFE